VELSSGRRRHAFAIGDDGTVAGDLYERRGRDDAEGVRLVPYVWRADGSGSRLPTPGAGEAFLVYMGIGGDWAYGSGMQAPTDGPAVAHLPAPTVTYHWNLRTGSVDVVALRHPGDRR
jgi:hypothetical protein